MLPHPHGSYSVMLIAIILTEKMKGRKGKHVLLVGWYLSSFFARHQSTCCSFSCHPLLSSSTSKSIVHLPLFWQNKLSFLGGPTQCLQPISLLLTAALRCPSKPDLEPCCTGFSCLHKYSTGHQGPACPGDQHIRGRLEASVTAPHSAPGATECVAGTEHLHWAVSYFGTTRQTICTDTWVCLQIQALISLCFIALINKKVECLIKKTQTYKYKYIYIENPSFLRGQKQSCNITSVTLCNHMTFPIRIRLSTF